VSVERLLDEIEDLREEYETLKHDLDIVQGTVEKALIRRQITKVLWLKFETERRVDALTAEGATQSV
jgi:hypothetical protein